MIVFLLQGKWIKGNVQLKIFTLLIFFSSCALFKSHDLRKEKVEKLLNSINLSGEGRGRMSLDQKQIVFGFDSILKENFDWVLAADFPLHGEEVLIMKDLNSDSLSQVESGLQERVEASLKNYLMKNGKSPQLADQFFLELHFLLQFVQSSKMGIPVNCNKQNFSDYSCLIRRRNFVMTIKDSSLTVSRSLPAGFDLEFVAENLSDSTFQRLNIYFFSQKQVKSSSPLMSLELFFR